MCAVMYGYTWTYENAYILDVVILKILKCAQKIIINLGLRLN